MKKVLAMLLAPVMMFTLLTACGNSGSQGGTQGNNPGTDPSGTSGTPAVRTDIIEPILKFTF